MKSFRQILNEVSCESHEEYDDMSLRELKAAVNAANEIISMLENGAELERWNESKITLASDYLVSICTYMKTLPQPEETEEPVEAEPEYIGHEYTHIKHPFINSSMFESAKASKEEAGYQNHPKNNQRCINCTMWRDPNKCTAVAGDISPRGWCEWYEGGSYGKRGDRV